MIPRHRELEHLKRELSGPPTDFSAAFLKVQDLRHVVHCSPEIVDHGTVRLLRKLLTHEPYQAQRQAYFFSRETALVLRDLVEGSPRLDVAVHARRVLERLCIETQGACQRASCEALGALSVSVAPAFLPPDTNPEDVPTMSLNHPCFRTWVSGAQKPWHRCGRSLWAYNPASGRLFIVKTAGEPEAARALSREIHWMRLLQENPHLVDGETVELPQPLSAEGPWLFQLESLEGLGLPRACSEPHRGPVWAITFTAPPGYFAYPNQPRNGSMPSKAAFLSTMVRSARVLGLLASSGIVHTAPIPLFHNRVQRHRREDRGLYRWPQGGRLDRWLESCDYPNFGESGVRDLEHLEPVGTGGFSLHEAIGMHFLSFCLVAGSYFRNRDRRLRGRQPDGTIVDVREWFDGAFLGKVIESVFRAYYKAFSGGDAPPDTPADLDRLSQRMIEEMGVDRHMEEILRVADQELMTDEEFWAFLEERGYSPQDARRFVRGKEDIVLLTGPHLGAFNDRISLPEMIHFVGAAAALCLSGRHFYLRAQKSGVPQAYCDHPSPAP